MLRGAQLDIDDTAKVPGPVKICVLKLPQVTVVPPVAAINVPPVRLDVESITFFHPSVSSTYTKYADCPSVFNVVLSFTPPIFCEPFGVIT